MKTMKFKYWILPCFIASVLYSIFFVLDIKNEGVFQTYFSDYLLFSFLFFIVSLVASLPLVLFYKSLIRYKQRRTNNIYIIFFVLLGTAYVATSFIMKDYFEAMLLIFAYGSVGLITIKKLVNSLNISD
jgi:hypothetical protein